MPLKDRRISVCLVLGLLALVDSGFGQFLSKRTFGSMLLPTPPAPMASRCGTTSITESSSDAITPGNSVSCNDMVGHADNSYFRAFDLPGLGASDIFDVCEVVVGIESASSGSGNGQPMTINLYTSSQPFPFGYPDSLTLIGSSAVTVEDQTATLLTIPVTGSAPANSQLVVEVFTPNGEAFGNLIFIGSNTAAQTAPGYLRAADCGYLFPTQTDALDDDLIMHIVMTVNGTVVSGLMANPASLQVDAPLPEIQVGGNGVLELNENATLTPGWSNDGDQDFTLTGAILDFTGPGVGLIFTINVPTAGYGLITTGTSKGCGADCYSINLSGVRSAQPTHLDVSIDERVTPADPPAGLVDDVILKTWTLHVGESFTDVTADGPAAPYYPSVETILHNNVTTGCGDGTVFCPTADVLRQEMAVFLIKAANQLPAACAGLFNDVPCDSIYAPYIEKLANLGVTAGCQSNPGFSSPVYCPEANVLRQEMAVFLIKASGNTTDACAGMFNDVPCDSIYAPFIEKLANLGVTAGCQSNPPFDPPVYCPQANVLRQEMAVFLTRTFGLVLYGP